MECIIAREYWFSAAHQLEGHPKCGRLHGHNYKVVVSLTNRSFNNGMIIDFGEMDKIVKPIIDELDHRYLVSEDNVRVRNPYVTFARSLKHSQNEDKWRLPFSTAECLSQIIYEHLLAEFNQIGIRVQEVSVQETEKSIATYK